MIRLSSIVLLAGSQLLFANTPTNFEFAVTEACNPCDTGDGANVGACSVGAGGTGTTSAPVFLFRGSAIELVTDLELSGITFAWSHTRTYDSGLTSLTSVPLPSISGERWIGGLSELHIEEEASGDITLIVNASTKRTFDESGGSYTAPADYTATLIEENAGTSTEEYILTHVDTGEVYVFYGFAASIDADLHGKLKRRSSRHFEETSKNGNEYVYHPGLFTRTSVCDQ